MKHSRAKNTLKEWCQQNDGLFTEYDDGEAVQYAACSFGDEIETSDVSGRTSVPVELEGETITLGSAKKQPGQEPVLETMSIKQDTKGGVKVERQWNQIPTLKDVSIEDGELVLPAEEGTWRLEP